MRDKEDRARTNKRKRDEKEEREREAKKRLVEKGHLPQDALLPKVSASQPRLNLFLHQPAKPIPEPQLPLPVRDDDDETVKGDSENEEDTLVNDQRPAFAVPDMDEAELEEFFSPISLQKDSAIVRERCEGEKEPAPQSARSQAAGTRNEPILNMDHNELEAQLGCPLSQALLGFDICEDPLSTSDQSSIEIPSPRKRKRSEDDFATPSKSARSALAEMSPGKVLLRSQEKPDITSAPSLIANILSPEKGGPSSSQIARETYAMIGTQDIDDNVEFSPEKENDDPLVETTLTRVNSNHANKRVSIKQATAGLPRLGTKSGSAKSDEFGSFDDSVFAELIDEVEDGEDIDDFDNGISDADWVGLSTQQPKNTAVSALGSPKKARDLPTKISPKSMAPPLRLPEVKVHVSKVKSAAPNDIQQAPCSFQLEAPIGSQNYSFDEDLEADMLALVDEVDLTGSELSRRAKKARTLPWQHRPADWDAMMAAGDTIEATESDA